MTVYLNNNAEKDLKKINLSNPKIAQRIRFFIDEVLSANQNIFALQNVKKLENEKNKYRWRIGDYRIIASYKKEILTIEIIRIAHRQEVYK